MTTDAARRVTLVVDLPQYVQTRAGRRLSVLRTLSVNGRATRWDVQTVRRIVAQHVGCAVLQLDPRPPRLRAPVQATLTYILPERRRRDQDNFSGGGVTKVAIDALVHFGILPGDHAEVLHLAPVQVVVERGTRALRITLEEVSDEVADPRAALRDQVKE